MSLMKQLIEEIQSKPVTQICPDCEGAGETRSHGWKTFFEKYGVESSFDESKFYLAETAILEEGDSLKSSFCKMYFDTDQVVKFCTKNELLTEQEAKDFANLYLNEPDIEECPRCEGSKKVHTEHGQLLADLIDLLS